MHPTGNITNDHIVSSLPEYDRYLFMKGEAGTVSNIKMPYWATQKTEVTV